MTLCVLDASVILDVLLDAPSRPALAELVGGEAADAAVPHLCDAEVLSGLRRLSLAGTLDDERAALALQHYLSLPLCRYEHTILTSRAFRLRDNFTTYDAMYVALAEGLGCPLVTRDQALSAAVRAHTDVEVVEA